MSKLIDRLNRVGQSAPSPIGFGAATRQERVSSILLIGRISVEDLLKKAVGSIDSVDAVAVLIQTIDDGVIGEAAKALEGRLWGIVSSSISEGHIDEIKNAGGDFVMFEAENTAASVLNRDDLGKILTLSGELDEETGAAIHELDVDAVQYDWESDIQPLTISKLIEIQLVRGMTGKPFVISAPSGLESAELESLRNIRVSALYVDLSDGEQISTLSESIVNLPLRRSSRGSRDAFVPQVADEPEE